MSYTENEVRDLVWRAFEAGWLRRAAYRGLDFDDHPAMELRYRIWTEAKNIFPPKPDDHLYVIKLNPNNIPAVAYDTKWSEEELLKFYAQARARGCDVKVCVSGVLAMPPEDV